MDDKLENPPAFPCKKYTYSNETGGVSGEFNYSGMNLRDYFAGQAIYTASRITPMLSTPDERVINITEMFYKIADEMLKQRNQS